MDNLDRTTRAVRDAHDKACVTGNTEVPSFNEIMLWVPALTTGRVLQALKDADLDFREKASVLPGTCP
jgi:hypothetical protein